MPRPLFIVTEVLAWAYSRSGPYSGCGSYLKCSDYSRIYDDVYFLSSDTPTGYLSEDGSSTDMSSDQSSTTMQTGNERFLYLSLLKYIPNESSFHWGRHRLFHFVKYMGKIAAKVDKYCNWITILKWGHWSITVIIFCSYESCAFRKEHIRAQASKQGM